MGTSVRLKSRCRDDAVDDLQLETHPNVQRAIFGLARHETRAAVRQFPPPFGRREVPLDG
jgi:hypothetical protein